MMTDDDTLRERLHYWFDRQYLGHINTRHFQIIIALHRPYLNLRGWPRETYMVDGRQFKMFNWAFCLGVIEVRKWSNPTRGLSIYGRNGLVFYRS